jgi:transposase-like protein
MGKRKDINWPDFIREYESGNLTIEQFCEEKGIHQNTFYRNRKRHRENATALVKLPLKKTSPMQQSLLVQINDFILKVPEGVSRETLETTLLVLKEIG